MNENFEPVNEQERLEEERLSDENEFLKMKLMLEQGAQFGTIQDEVKLPAAMENDFLNYIMAYEKQSVERKMIKVFDRIERPAHFKPVNEIPGDQIENAWDGMDAYLRKYNIELTVCSPNISAGELYRFAIEELFEHEMNDMDVPGMSTCFTYDEFYPDHKYDNTRYAVDDCIKEILVKEKCECLPWLRDKNISINKHNDITEKEFNEIVNRFKEAYDDITVNEIKDTDFSIDENFCQVKGKYDIIVKLPVEEINMQGKWEVNFENEDGYWRIVKVQIEGINF